MLKITTTLFSIASLLTIVSSTAVADINIINAGSGTHSSAVRIYQPTQNKPPLDEAQTPEQVQITIYKSTTIVRPRFDEYILRKERLKRALGHRYLGFKKQYRGYKYPF